MDEASPPPRSSPLYAAFVGGLALLAYLNALENGFVLDDFGLVLGNGAVRDFAVGFLLSSDYWAGFAELRSGLYRPLTLLSFALEYRFWGANPIFFHAANIGLHALVSILVYALGRRLSGEGVGVLAGLLFAVHPVHTEAVAGIAGRADLLAALFSLAALLASARARERGGRGWWFSAPLLALGLLSKEQAAVVPALLLCLDWLRYRRGRMRAWPWREYALQGAVLLAWLVLRWAVLGGAQVPAPGPLDNPLAPMPAHLRLINASEIALRYLFLLVFPYRLSADYSYNALPLSQDFFSEALFWSGVLALVLALLLWRFWTRPSARSLSGMWMLVSFSLVGNWVVPIGTIMAERLLYMPSAGFCWLAAAVLVQVWVSGRKRAAFVSCALLVLIFMGRTWVRNGDWRDEERLFRAAASAQPRSARAHEGLGTALMRKGDMSGALASYRRALAIYPHYASAHYNAGLVHWGLQQYERARAAFAEAARLEPGDEKNWLNLGASLHALGRAQEAEAAYERAVELRPDFVLAWMNLGDTLYELGDGQGAARAYGRVLELEPEHPRRREFEERMGGG